MRQGGIRRLLVVEDDPEMQYLFSTVLGAEDREVAVAATGEEASRLLEQGWPDLVVLDLILPDTDGRRLLSELRSRPETVATPVVVVTSRGGTEIRHDCYQLGADYFVEKPFDPVELAEEVARRLDRSADPQRAAGRDAVTGLLNLVGLRDTCDRLETEYALGVIEIDGLTDLSERWGWGWADEVVGDVGRALGRGLPDTMIARVSGGELTVLMPDSDSERHADLGERCLDIVRALSVVSPDGAPHALTATIAVVERPDEASVDEALEVARRRIFQSRAFSGDQVVAEQEEADPAEKARVLVAEDDEISATLLLHRLEKEGLEVLHFDNGQDAYEAALEEVPSLVILDIKMPGLDGFEVLRRLRSEPSLMHTPIVLLTSMGSESDVVRGFKLGADDYILKPFSPVELSARVRRLLRRGRSMPVG